MSVCLRVCVCVCIGGMKSSALLGQESVQQSKLHGREFAFYYVCGAEKRKPWSCRPCEAKRTALVAPPRRGSKTVENAALAPHSLVESLDI